MMTLEQIKKHRKEGLYSDEWILERVQEMEHMEKCMFCNNFRNVMNKHMGVSYDK